MKEISTVRRRNSSVGRLRITRLRMDTRPRRDLKHVDCYNCRSRRSCRHFEVVTSDSSRISSCLGRHLALAHRARRRYDFVYHMTLATMKIDRKCSCMYFKQYIQCLNLYMLSFIQHLQYAMAHKHLFLVRLYPAT